MPPSATLPPFPNSPAARDVAFHAHPYTNLKTHLDRGPLVIERGEGVRVWDDDGRAYIEAMSGLWCTALGWSEPRLVEAARRQLDTLPFYHSFTGRVPRVLTDLAEKLIGLAPVPMSKVFFANSGSEANDTAVKLVWYYNNARGRPDKKKIIARQRAYHGVTVATASLTGLPANHRDFDLPLERMRHTICPDFYRHGQDGESEEGFATRCADDLERLIEAEGPDTVAAFFAEPVMAAGGVIVPPATYFEKIQAVLRRHDVLFIADEVVCGFGRTGNWWGSQTFDLAPDMITTAKALSSAYVPISGLMVNEDVFQAMVAESGTIGVFGHGFTYSGHPVAAAVALEALRIYEERDMIGRARTLAPRLQDGLRRFSGHPLVGDVRGIGMVGAVELVRDKTGKAPFDPPGRAGALVVERAQAHGLIVRALGDTIAFAPPLVIEADDIDALLERFGRALDETAARIAA